MTVRHSIANARVGEPQQNSDGSTVFEFKFGAGDPVFAGHFPGHPILPGVFQLEMVRVAAESVLNCPLTIREIRKSKFQRPILPDEVARVELKLTEKEGMIEARAGFSVGGQPAGETAMLLWRNA
jgi:3-hydroxyacyl-[acyl-carrier-protein] dehydratase